MTDRSQQATVHTLLDQYGRTTLAEEAEIHLRNQPHALFQVFQLALLVDARLGPEQGIRTFLALRERRWSTAGGLREAEPGDVFRMLSDKGLPEGDASRISTALSDAALHLLEDHGGDLSELRENAGRDPERERQVLRHFASVDDRSVDAYFREVQLLWDEVRPFADKAVLDSADRLGLPADTGSLRELVADDHEFVCLVDALLRARHQDGSYERVRELAMQEA